MALTIVNATRFQIGYNVHTITIPSTTAGNSLYILAYMDIYSGDFTDPSEITISGGGTWAFDPTQCSDTDGGQATGFLAYLGSTSAGVTSLSLTPPSGQIWEEITGYVYEISGTDTAAPIQAVAAASSPSASASASPASSGVALVISQSHATTGSWPSGYTDNSGGANLWYFNAAYNTSTASGSQTVSNTASSASSLYAFWPAPGSSGPVTITLTEQTWAWSPQSAGVERQMVLAGQAWEWGIQTLSYSGRFGLALRTWTWGNQPLTLSLRHPLASQVWAWGAQTIGPKSLLALASKSWRWLTQDIGIQQSGPVELASRLWAWTGQQINTVRRVELASKAWNWGSQALYIAGKLTLAGKTWAWQKQSIAFHWLLSLAPRL